MAPAVVCERIRESLFGPVLFPAHGGERTKGAQHMTQEQAIDARVLAEMRDWLADCFGDDETEGMSDAEVIRGVNRNYEGGVDAFLLSVSAPVEGGDA